MDDLENDVSSPPATMAEVFFALIAVVIIMLLALLPAIRKPEALAAPAGAGQAGTDLRIHGSKPDEFVAEEDGLRFAKRPPVALDRMLGDEALRAALESASKAGRDVLLVVRPRGREAAFLFDAVAHRAGVSSIYQLRVDAGCAYVADRDRLAGCRGRWRPGSVAQ